MTTVGRDELLAMRDRCNEAYYTTNSKIAQLALVDVSELLQKLAEGADDAAGVPAAMAAEMDGMSIRCRRASNTTNSKTAQNALGAAADIIRQIGRVEVVHHSISPMIEPAYSLGSGSGS